MPARTTFRLAAFVPLAATLLAGCSAATRISQIGEMPPMTTIQDPQRQPGYQPVSLPMPQPITAERRPNSLWQTGSRAFFKDQRAANIGDILTVVVNFDEKAKFDDNTQRQMQSANATGAANLFGLEGQIQKILPHDTNMSSLVNTTGNSNNNAQSEIKREENVNLSVATEVTQVLPNGNLVVNGRQEFRVNYEVRELQVAGVVRPQDIGPTNMVNYDKLAEARISYGGRGQMMDIQQPRFGQQLLDIIDPF